MVHCDPIVRFGKSRNGFEMGGIPPPTTPEIIAEIPITVNQWGGMRLGLVMDFDNMAMNRPGILRDE